MKLTPGKIAGMKAVSDSRGVIAAAAMDQRGSLKKALAKEKGGDVSDRDVYVIGRDGVVHLRPPDSGRSTLVLTDSAYGKVYADALLRQGFVNLATGLQAH